MPIEISYKKITDGRRQEVEILEINALKKNRLPVEYFQDFPFCYKSRLLLEDTPDNDPYSIDCLICCIHPDVYATVRVGDTYPKDLFFDHMAPAILDAGNRLGRINTRIKKRAEEAAYEKRAEEAVNECNEKVKKEKPWQGAFRIVI